EPLGAGNYIVAVRAPKGVAGQWFLFFQHIPTTCVDGRVALVPGQQIQENTCQRGDNYAPSCGGTSREDLSYLVTKCPNVDLQFRACAGPDRSTPPVLSALWTSMQTSAASGLCTPIGNARVDQCNAAPAGSTCTHGGAPAIVTILQDIPGMVLVSVDSTVVGTLSCGLVAVQYQTSAN